MPNIVPISRERHASKRWKRFTSYAFAEPFALVSLVASELSSAAGFLPVAFVRQSDRYLPTAVMGIEPGVNLLVGQDGRWLGGYVPSALRGYPFSLARAEGSQLVLCIDEDSGLLSEGDEGERFFSEDGTPDASLNRVMDFLRQVERGRILAEKACAALAHHGLIRPWPVKLKTDSGERQVQGLFQVDEERLQSLSDEAFLDLRHAGAIPLAYCQLLSMQQMRGLGKLAVAKAKAQMMPQLKSAGSFVLQDDDLLSF